MKKGITTSVIILAVIIMFILITATATIGSNAIRTVNYEEYMSKLKRVSDAVNEYETKNEEFPITGEAISKGDLDADLVTELEENGDTNSNLFVVDMNLLKISGVGIGSGTIENKNVFVVAEDTGNVYYYKGHAYKGTRYYGV